MTIQRRTFVNSATLAGASLALPKTYAQSADTRRGERDIDVTTLTPAVIARFGEVADARLKHVLTAAVTHLHDLAREVKLTEAEWMQAIEFLTATGQKSDAKRQEFILLSDVLGLSMLVVMMNHASPKGATEPTVLGPFHVDDAPLLKQDADIAAGAPGSPMFVEADVCDLAGRPIRGAEVDVWQADSEGLYDVQRRELGDKRRARGVLRSDASGSVRFRTVKPIPYAVPTDGPVGRLLKASGRHAWRPAHLHFRIRAPGFQTLVTHLFFKGDPYLGSDAVFGVRSSLIANLVLHPPGVAAGATTVAEPFYTLRQRFALAPLEEPMRDRRPDDAAYRGSF